MPPEPESGDSPGESPELETERMVEAILFASETPLTRKQIEGMLPPGCDVRRALASLVERFAGRGVELRQAGGSWAFRTAPDLRGLFDREVVAERKLSRAALETLAIIAYHQPVTRLEIEGIRGVAVSPGTVNTLMELGWVGLGRRRRTPGRPVTYVVTDAFLDHFGLASARDLPGIKEIRSLGLLDRAAESAADEESGEAGDAAES